VLEKKLMILDKSNNWPNNYRHSGKSSYCIEHAIPGLNLDNLILFRVFLIFLHQIRIKLRRIIIIIIEQYPESNNSNHFSRIYVQPQHQVHVNWSRYKTARRIPKKIPSRTLALPWHFTKYKNCAITCIY